MGVRGRKRAWGEDFSAGCLFKEGNTKREEKE